MQQKKKRKISALGLVQLAALVVVVISAAAILRQLYIYWQGEKTYEDLRQQYTAAAPQQESDGQQKLLRNVVRLSRDLGLRTVVEGIETAENAALVRAVGCDVGQGYYYSRPISVADFEAKYFSDKLPPKADL